MIFDQVMIPKDPDPGSQKVADPLNSDPQTV